MAATRPSSAIRAGSPDSGQWWDSKDFADFTKAARTRQAAGDYAALESIYAQGYQRARALGHQAAQISYLNNLGTARMLSLRYAPALEAFLEASALAEQTGDWPSLGGIAVNLAGLYARMGDTEAALGALERGKTALDRIGRVPVPYKAQLLMRLRSIRAGLRESPSEYRSAEPSYQDAIEAAREAGDTEAESAAWDLLGKEKIDGEDLEGAEAALGQALRLRISYFPKNLGFSYAALGALRLAQANRSQGEERRRRAKEAEALTQRAIGMGSPGPAIEALLHQRGEIREMRGQRELALEDFRAALNQASHWNGAVPAALSLVTGTNVALQHEIFDSFVDAAAGQALRTGDRNLAADAFMALETNRAASLRESRELAPMWKKRLPVAYWETLGRLNEEEAREPRIRRTMSSETNRLHLKLTEMESAAGAGVSVRLAENFRTQTSLIHFRQGLGESDLLLSFYGDYKVDKALKPCNDKA